MYASANVVASKFLKFMLGARKFQSILVIVFKSMGAREVFQQVVYIMFRAMTSKQQLQATD